MWTDHQDLLEGPKWRPEGGNHRKCTRDLWGYEEVTEAKESINPTKVSNWCRRMTLYFNSTGISDK